MRMFFLFATFAHELGPCETVAENQKVVAMIDLLKAVGIDALVELSHRLGKRSC